MKKLFLSTLVIVIIGVFMTGCGQKQDIKKTVHSPKSNPIQVVAAENFYGEVAKAVGGRWVHVTSVIDNPAVDPHDFEATPEASKLVSEADLIIFNGAGYDAWMEKIRNASSHKDKIYSVNVAGDLMGVKEGENEHVWYNPKTMPKLTEELAKQFAKLDPAHANDFERNADQYISSLEPLNSLIEKLRQTNPTAVDVSEPVFDYMLEAMNFKVNNPKFALAIDEGSDPSPKDYLQIQTDIKEKKIAFFVDNIQNDSPTVQNLVTLAKQNDVPIIKVTETIPKDEDYVQWMINQLKQIQKIIKQ